MCSSSALCKKTEGCHPTRLTHVYACPSSGVVTQQDIPYCEHTYANTLDLTIIKVQMAARQPGNVCGMR